MLKLRRCFAILCSSMFGVLLALTVFVGNASAHAKVIDSNPKMGSTITTAPTTITVTAAENMNPDPKLSNLFVYGPTGELISQGNAKVSLNNPKEMSIGITAGGNGVYVVRWITVSAEDGDPDQGAFIFTVKPGGTAQPSTGHRTTTIAAGTGGMPLWVPIVVGILALLIGLGGGFVLGRRDAISPVRTMRRKVAEQEQQEEDLPTKGTS